MLLQDKTGGISVRYKRSRILILFWLGLYVGVFIKFTSFLHIYLVEAACFLKTVIFTQDRI